jgi:hypothetical protein
MESITSATVCFEMPAPVQSLAVQRINSRHSCEVTALNAIFSGEQREKNCLKTDA